jgi:hypothetical protein
MQSKSGATAEGIAAFGGRTNDQFALNVSKIDVTKSSRVSFTTSAGK